METEGKIIQLNGRLATVEIRRKGACGDSCVSCTGCNAQIMQIQAYSELPLKVGDWVIVSSAQKPVLLGMFVLFILPLILPVLVYLLTRQTGFGGLFALLAVCLSLLLIWRLGKSSWYLEKTRPGIKGVISENRESR